MAFERFIALLYPLEIGHCFITAWLNSSHWIEPEITLVWGNVFHGITGAAHFFSSKIF